jgi:hypothetical protein
LGPSDVAVGLNTLTAVDMLKVVVVVSISKLVVADVVVRKVLRGVDAVWVVTVVVEPVTTATQAFDKREGDQETAEAGVARSRFWKTVLVVVV